MLGGKLLVKDFEFYNSFPVNTVRLFMLENGIYVLPTTELVAWIKENIIGTAIEIGAGHGAISRQLGIPITDSWMQDRPDIKLYYQMCGQPVIKYHQDVEKLDAIEAIKKYKPDTVIGAFITHKYVESINSGNAFGVKEEFILQNAQRYINIGNLVTHRDKPILEFPHDEHYFQWIITRSADQKNNRIFVWNKN